MRFSQFFTILIVILAFLSKSFSQDVYPIDFQRGVLTNNGNYSFIQTKDRAVWLCSDAGIVKFYNNSYRQFTIKDGLSRNDFWKMKEDSKGRVWLSSFANQIHYIWNNKVYDLTILKPLEYGFFAGEHGDTLFFNIHQGALFKYRKFLTKEGEIGIYKLPSQPDLQVYGDFREKGLYVLAKGNKLFQYHIGEPLVEIEPYIVSIQHRTVVDGEKYFAVNDSKLYQIVEVGNKYVLKKQKSLDFQIGIFSLLDQNQKIKIVENGYHYVYKDVDKNSRDFQMEQEINDALKEKILWSCFQDNTGNYWVVDNKQSACFLDKVVKSRTWIKLPKDVDFNIQSIKKTPSGDFIFSSRSRELYLHSSRDESVSLVLLDHIISDFAVGSSRIIARTSGGILLKEINELYEENSKINLNWRKIKLHSLAQQIALLNNNEALIGDGSVIDLTTGKVLYRLLKKDQHPVRGYNVLCGNGLAIFYTNNVLFVIDTKTRKTVYKNLNLKINLVSTLDSQLVIFTTDKKMITYSFDNFSSPVVTKLPFVVRAMEEMGERIFLSTSDGIVEGKMVKGRIRLINNYKYGFYGVNSLAFLIYSDAFYAVSNGGILKLNEEYFNIASSPPIFQVKVKQNNTEYVPNGKRLKMNMIKSISFTIVVAEFFNLHELYFRYRVKNDENLGEWVYTKNRHISFFDFKEGLTEIEVQSSYNPLFGYSNSQKISFVMLEPFTRTLFFKIIALLILCVGLFFGYIILKRRATKLSKRDLRLLELQYQSTTSQLNPHFIFNSMNSIQSLIFKNDKIAANAYLSVFSKLVRKSLDNSRMKKISLFDEMTFLSDYLTIEKTRLNNNLSFSIETIDILNPSNVFIYPMILQPIVENALIHGFVVPEHPNILELKFKLKKDKLICEIIDNGVGRMASLKKKKSYSSLSSSILEEKMAILNKIKAGSLNVILNDLEDNEGSPMGTHVIIEIGI